MTDEKVKEAVERVRGWIAGRFVTAGHEMKAEDIHILLAEMDKLAAEVERLTERYNMFCDESRHWNKEYHVQKRRAEDGEAKLTALVEALDKCRHRFREYEASHAIKGTQDADLKALRNREMAEMCERTIFARHSAPVEPFGCSQGSEAWADRAPDGAIDYAAVSFADFRTVLGRIEDDFPNHGDYSLALPCGHWRAIRDALSAPPSTPTSAPVEDVGGLQPGDLEWLRECVEEVRVGPDAIGRMKTDVGLRAYRAQNDRIDRILSALPALIQPQGEERS